MIDNAPHTWAKPALYEWPTILELSVSPSPLRRVYNHLLVRLGFLRQKPAFAPGLRRFSDSPSGRFTLSS